MSWRYMVKMLAGLLDRLKLFTVSRSEEGEDPLCVSLWHEFHKPPYGGGNQFMLALKDALVKRGVIVVSNIHSTRVHVHICNSAWFNTESFEKQSKRHTIKMIHRIDGPVSLYRGTGEEEDLKIHSINSRFASATVYQSEYCYKKSKELGYQAVAPLVIHNAVNSRIFNTHGRNSFSRDRKVRIISSAWSDNPRKGGPLFKWLDQHLDWNKFEYTFVGRVKQSFKHIKHIPPQDSSKLAELLRQHDIYISASKHEPCSNALLEALACGLPALHRNDGGNPELVGSGGLPFEDKQDILQQLEKLVAEYEMYQSAIVVRSMDEVAGQYLQLAHQLVKSKP